MFGSYSGNSTINGTGANPNSNLFEFNPTMPPTKLFAKNAERKRLLDIGTRYYQQHPEHTPTELLQNTVVIVNAAKSDRVVEIFNYNDLNQSSLSGSYFNTKCGKGEFLITTDNRVQPWYCAEQFWMRIEYSMLKGGNVRSSGILTNYEKLPSAGGEIVIKADRNNRLGFNFTVNQEPTIPNTWNFTKYLENVQFYITVFQGNNPVNVISLDGACNTGSHPVPDKYVVVWYTQHSPDDEKQYVCSIITTPGNVVMATDTRDPAEVSSDGVVIVPSAREIGKGTRELSTDLAYNPNAPR